MPTPRCTFRWYIMRTKSPSDFFFFFFLLPLVVIAPGEFFFLFHDVDTHIGVWTISAHSDENNNNNKRRHVERRKRQLSRSKYNSSRVQRKKERNNKMRVSQPFSHAKTDKRILMHTHTYTQAQPQTITQKKRDVRNVNQHAAIEMGGSTTTLPFFEKTIPTAKKSK